MFVGQSSHQIDEKGRIRIPAKFKDGLGKNPFITIGANNCLCVYSNEDAHVKFIKRFADSDMADEVANMALRAIMANAYFAEEDSQGRVLLPANLLEHAKISKNIVTIGVLDHVEIWSEEIWLSYRQGIDFDNVLKMLKKDKN